MRLLQPQTGYPAGEGGRRREKVRGVGRSHTCGWYTRPSSLSSVVLPQPERPRMPTLAPSGIIMLTCHVAPRVVSRGGRATKGGE